MYFIAFTVFTSAKTRTNPGRNKDSENIHLGRNPTRRTEYTPLQITPETAVEQPLK